MTNHEQLETMLRSSLSERAGDVDTTPALYDRVQRQATRGTWLRRGVALAGAAAAIVVAVTVVPALLPDQPLRPDVAETPDLIEPTEPAEPTEEPSVDPTEGVAPGVAIPALQQANVAFADDTGRVTVGERTVAGPASVVSLAVSPFWTAADGAVAAGLADGRIGVVDQRSDGGADFDVLVDASTNGGGVVFSPDGEAVAWIEGTDLHILPLASELDGERVAPLEGEVPDDLRIEQWFYAADAQVILASDPSGGIWRIPMDDSDAYNSGPTDPAARMPAAADTDAVDAALLPDLSLAVLRVSDDGVATLTVADAETTIGDQVDRTTELSTTGASATVFDATTGIGVRLLIADGTAESQATWEAPGITAVAPLPANPDGTDEPSGAAGASDAADLGLPTGAPVVGTAGRSIIVVVPPDERQGTEFDIISLEVYPSESEATLGRVAVRPGSTLDAGLVAVESFSEGENSIRLVALRDGGASPVGDVLIADGPVTGLVWSEDGTRIAWTDTAGLHESPLSDSGGLGGELLAADTGPVLDWVWTQMDDVAATGYFAMGVNGVTGVELLGIERASDETVTLTGSVGGADRVVLSTHANPGAAVGPEVIAQLGGGTAVLTWSADGDRSGELPDPGQLGGDVRVQVSGGQVLVMGDSRQVLVSFDGQVLDLPTAADWDVLD